MRQLAKNAAEKKRAGFQLKQNQENAQGCNEFGRNLKRSANPQYDKVTSFQLRYWLNDGVNGATQLSNSQQSNSNQ